MGMLPIIQRIAKLRGVVATKKYVNKAFSKYLLATNVALSMGLSGLGDACQQKYQIESGQMTHYNVARTAHMTTTGMTVGALCHYWYQVLDRTFPGHTGRIIAKKLIADQIIFSPICLLAFFFTLCLSRKVLRNADDAIISQNIAKDSQNHPNLENEVKELNTLIEELRHKGILLYLSEWIIWPPAQFINFYFLPTQFRVLYDNLVSLLYDIYTSHVCYDLDLKDAKDLLSLTV